MLTDSEIQTLTNRGRYGDGKGLYLVVTPSGSKNWVLRFMVQGVRRDIGLGAYPNISIGQARAKATDFRAGKPIKHKKVAPHNQVEKAKPKSKSLVPTFGEATLRLHEINQAKFRSDKHGKNWLQMVEKYCFPTLRDKPLNQISRKDVLDVLTPIWTGKQETARRIRQRMRNIFDWAVAYEYIDYNPAGESISAALPSMPRDRQHFPALPYSEVPEAVKTIQRSSAGLPIKLTASKLALEFVILTAARSGEVREATWQEIDWEKRLWIIPECRMKGGIEHRVPLSEAALDVLNEALRIQDNSTLIFPSPVKEGQPLSNMTLTKIMRSTGLAETGTVHGFRSSFRDWASENTNATFAVMELCLAHRVGNDVVQSYARSDLLEQRRLLMESWAAYLIPS